jgi:hypothetical protein
MDNDESASGKSARDKLSKLAAGEPATAAEEIARGGRE